MLRAILIALSGLGYFIISLPMMMPLRMMKEPIVNYNLFLGTFFVVMLGFLFYKCCTVEKESKAYVYGFFGGMVAWQLFGELASMPLNKGVITQFSNVNIKLLGGYFYVAGAWLALKIMWRTKAIKNPVSIFFLTFLCIWTFELYMDNYSLKVPVALMPTISYCVGAVSAVLSIVLLVIAKKAETDEKKTVMGCLLYITISLVIMGFGQWNKPQSFYVKYEAGHLDKEILELQEERKQLHELKAYMIKEGIIKIEEEETEQTQAGDQPADKR